MERRNDPAQRVQQIAVRAVVDASGRRWEVREIVDHQYDRRGQRALLFCSDEIMRRVRGYPADWLTLSDAELMKISLTR